MLKYKLLRRTRSISAPRMTVRRHVSWPMRVAFVLVLVGAFLIGGKWIYELGREFAGFGEDLRSEVTRLKNENAALVAERDRLEHGESEAQSRLNIERSTQEQLGRQIKTLEHENAKLKDDVAFFENLSANGPVSGLAIKRMRVEADVVPEQMRYRILVTQGGKQDRDFSGELQLLVTLQHEGKADIMNLPGSAPDVDPKAFLVNFRLFERLEGTFRVPTGTVVKQVEARILEKGVVRADQTVMVS